MFTGLITDIGTMLARDQNRFTIASTYAAEGIALGASMCCDGCCLTVNACDASDAGGSIFSLDVSNETLSCTTLGAWQAGRQINLERALTPSSELGGHIVTGHVDAVAEIVARDEDGDSMRFKLQVPDQLSGFIAQKGSVALDGVSLTVNDVEGATFGINLIPHTLTETTWSERAIGDGVNLEVDLLARYVARIGATMKTRSL